ncbi:HEAT repeat domain-containing protein [Flavobacterium suzhouense]|uniref:HEAT repeat domain-containing protein n=1 Tax=Flavobacterium suzhouense TaxID=1529638 RepID=A0ABW5NQA4_9FLAO
MEHIWNSYKSGIWLDTILLWLILLFIGIAGMLFLFIIVIRSEKITRRKNYDNYNAVIETIFMHVVFAGRSYASIISDPEYSQYFKIKYFRKQLMKSIINMHQNYDGTSAKILESFYFESGLMETSLAKLKDREMHVVCSGIQELAEMKITKAFPLLVKLSQSRSKEIKIAAIKACTKLNGNKGIVHLAYHKDPIDMWEQVNIVSAFKRNYVEDNDEIELLLTSGNTTVISLGLKIIHTLELARKLPYVVDLAENAPNEQIKFEAQELLLFLTTKNQGDDRF